MEYEVKIYCTVPMLITDNMIEFLKNKELEPNGITTKHFEDKDALFHYVRNFDYISSQENTRNHLLEAIMCSKNDSQRHKQSFDRKGYTLGLTDYYLLGYMIYDSEGKIIDLRNYTDELYKFNNNAYSKRKREERRLKYERLYAIHDERWQKHWALHEGEEYWSYCRSIQTTQELRWASNSENKPYVRGKRSRSSLPNAFDDLTFDREKTWKARSKRKRQWLLKYKNHIYILYTKDIAYEDDITALELDYELEQDFLANNKI